MDKLKGYRKKTNVCSLSVDRGWPADEALLLMAKTRTGVKYCGGCNPNYEREVLVRAMQERVGESFLFLHHEQGDLDGIIAVSGCPRACAAEGLDRWGIPYHSIMAEGNLPGLIEWLLASGQKRGQRRTRRRL